MKELFSYENGHMTIQMPKEIDHHCAKELRQDIDRMIEVSHVRNVTFDFSQTEFMDSSDRQMPEFGIQRGECAGGPCEWQSAENFYGVRT